ncbi:MAG: restriction endonuclease subunit S [Flavobacteriales bacterium]|nr:MAG: restriction endonuclease subunit S [Flavobacteriales bacterium]
MSNWESILLGQACDILDNQRVPLNDEQRFSMVGDVPYYGANGVVDHIDRFMFNEPLILLAEDGGNFDEHETRPIAYRIDGKSWVNNHAHVLRAKSEFEQDFVFYALQHKDIRSFIKGGTRTKLNQSDLRAIRFEYPSDRDIQRTIARILGTMDALIEQTEALIEKQRQIKQGMLHDLFTRGVDASGQLRPPQHEAPELYKETKLGWVPKDWEQKTLNEVKQFITSGSRGWAAYYADEGALFIRIGNLSRDHINFRWEDVQYVVPPMGSEGSRTAVEAGDLLISITADLGITAVVPAGMGEAYVNQHIALVRLDPSATNPRWVGMYLAGENGVTQFQRLNDAGTKAGLNLPTVGALRFANPPRDERDHIVGLIDAQDALIAEETANHSKLLSMKAGLMQDLLTGRVPVDHLVESMNEKVATVANPS